MGGVPFHPYDQRYRLWDLRWEQRRYYLYLGSITAHRIVNKFVPIEYYSGTNNVSTRETGETVGCPYYSKNNCGSGSYPSPSVFTVNTEEIQVLSVKSVESIQKRHNQRLSQLLHAIDCTHHYIHRVSS